MALTSTSSNTAPARRLKLIHLVGLLALLAPAAYLIGRFSALGLAQSYFNFIPPIVVATSLGMLFGIPIGLFFGSQRAIIGSTPTAVAPGMTPILKHEPDILYQLRQELTQIQVLFEARKGNQQVLSRISYPTAYWDALQASGQLFVMSEPALMHTVASAYYWVKQASRLENLAFESRFTNVVVDNQDASAHLIADARMLDGPLETSLASALSAIGQALGETAPATPPTT
jgi:hypothetical protein